MHHFYISHDSGERLVTNKKIERKVLNKRLLSSFISKTVFSEMTTAYIFLLGSHVELAKWNLLD